MTHNVTKVKKRILAACSKIEEKSSREILKNANVTSGTGDRQIKELIKDEYITRRKRSRNERVHSDTPLTTFMYLRTNKEIEE
jgi:DNA-binding MarR family transcriptional regulator